jgi:hypothetical protein
MPTAHFRAAGRVYSGGRLPQWNAAIGRGFVNVVENAVCNLNRRPIESGTQVTWVEIAQKIMSI